MQVGELLITLGLDISALSKAIDEAANVVKGKMQSAEKASKFLLGGLATTGAGLAALGVKALTMAGQMEQAQTAFTTMLGSAEKATALMKDLREFGAETPFEFPEIQAAAKSLLAFGINADQVKSKLREIGDISSGVGAPIGEIAELYGKAKVQGRLFAEDVNQLTGRGIPIIQTLAQQFGVTDDKVKGLVEAGKIGFPELEKAFTSLTAQGSQFGGMMAAQSQTLPGMWSNLMDSLGQSATVVGQELITAFNIKEKLQGVIVALGQLATILQQEGLSGAIQKLFPAEAQQLIVMISGGIVGALVPAFGSMASAAWAALAPLIPFMAAGAAVAGLAFIIYKNWGPIRQFFVDMWTGIKTTFEKNVEALIAGWEVFKTTFQPVVTAFSNAGKKIVQILSGLKDSAVEWGTGLVQGLWNGIETAGSWLKDKFAGWAGEVKNHVKNLFGIHSPSTVFAEIGENLSEGLALGLQNASSKVREAALGLIESMMGTVKTAVDTYNTNVAQAMEQFRQQEQQLTEEYQRELDTRTSSLYNWIGIFDEVPEKMQITGQDLITNLKEQVGYFRDWQTGIADLAKRAVDDGLIKELQDMGPKALPQIEALSSMSDTELGKYVELWRTKHQLAGQESALELEGFRVETGIKLEALRADTNTKLQQYALEFVTKIKGIKDDSLTQLHEMAGKGVSIGSSLIANIISGIASQKGELRSELDDIASMLSEFGAGPVPTVSLSGIPALASGGIVNRPTVALIGEAGPEAVIPLSKTGGAGATIGTINIYGNNADEIWSKFERKLALVGVRL